MKSRFFAGTLLLASSTVFAQTTVPASAPAGVAAPSPVAALSPDFAILRTGTEVPLKLSEELTTKDKKARVGQRFRMETAESVMLNGVTIIPVGSPAVGEITDVRNKGMWGKSGQIGARVLYVTVNGRQIRLSGAFDDKGKAGGVGAAAVSAIVFLPAGFFMTGTSARIPIGAPVKGFVDEDVQLAMAATAPAALTVAAPAAPVSAPVAPASATMQPAVLETISVEK
jgi:hypothetical protein